MVQYMYGMAEVFAKEMIEHNLKCGATSLNTDFIAEQACQLAYKIDHKVKSYVTEVSPPLTLTEQDIERIVAKHVHKRVPQVTPPTPVSPPTPAPTPVPEPEVEQ